MKKLSIGVLGLLLACGVAFADTFTVTAPTTEGAIWTNTVVASGWLDKIEMSQEADGTCTVVVATYDALNTAIDTYATLSASADQSKVVRTRLIGTGNSGTALAGVVYTDGGINTNLAATTVLVGAYERPMIGGNTQVKITGGGGGGTGLTNDVVVRIYYEPVKK